MNTIKSAAQAERIILAMLEHCTLEKAAAALGMSTTTVWRWLKKTEFQELYLKARRDAYSHVTGRARFVAPSAVATLMTVMGDPKAPPAAQLRAARAILKNANTFLFEELKARAESIKAAQEAEMEEDEIDFSLLGPPVDSRLKCNRQGIPGRSGASTAKMDRISLAVLRHGSLSQAAAVCKVSITTIWRYSQKPEFEEHCRRARYEKYALAISVMQWAANTAMSTLIRLTNHNNVGIRVRAAEAILDLARADVLEDLQAVIEETNSVESNEEDENEEES